MGTYIVGDIHGCYDEWIKLKNKIERQDKEAKFILIGDIVDRGPKVCKMIAWAMKNITPDGKYQMILGNHEDMKIQWRDDYKRQLNELLTEKRERYGDEFTRTVDYRDFNPDSYDFAENMCRAGYTDQQVEKIINFFRNLPLYKELKIDMGNKKQHFIVVHGGITHNCLNEDESFSKRSIKMTNDSVRNYTVRANRENILWDRTYNGRTWLKNTIVVHGHSPTLLPECEWYGAVPGKICYTWNDINVDCGEVYNHARSEDGNLAAIRLEDFQEFYAHGHKIREHCNEARNNHKKELMLKTKRERRQKKKQLTEEDKRLLNELDKIFGEV